VLAGNSQSQVTYPSGTSFVAPVGPGASSPGLWFPEIYVPFQRYLVYDVLRTDSAFVAQGAVAQNYPIAFIGAKVFEK
jgi:hypothetical protein